MTLGALVDVGVPSKMLRERLSTLKLDAEFSLRFEKATKHSITGTRAIVEVHPAHTSHADSHHEHAHAHHHAHDHGHHHAHGPTRHLSDIFALLDDSDLDPEIRNTAKRVFDRLAEAEAKVHNMNKADVHLHEVSGIDSIVDIVGSVIGLTYLDVDAVYASPLSLGTGFVQCAHGRMPVPVPGTMELLIGVPDSSNRYTQRTGNADGCCTHYDSYRRNSAPCPTCDWIASGTVLALATLNNAPTSSASASVNRSQVAVYKRPTITPKLTAWTSLRPMWTICHQRLRGMSPLSSLNTARLMFF